MWKLVFVLAVITAQTNGFSFSSWFSSPSLSDKLETLQKGKQEIDEKIIPVLMDRYPDMPKHLLEGKDVEKVVKYLNNNSKELRARSDAKTVTMAEAVVTTKLEKLNTKADEMLMPLLEHYLNFKLGEHKIEVDTIHKLKAAIKKASVKKDQKETIKRLLKDL